MNLSENIEKYLSNLVVFSDSFQNFNSLKNLSNLLIDELNIEDFELCFELLEKYEVLNCIVKNVVESNLDTIAKGHISSICSNYYFVSLIQIFCMNNGIYIESEMKEINLDNVPTYEYYYKMIKTIPLLSKDEERNLFILLNDQNAKVRSVAKKKLVDCNLRLVVSIASKYLKFSLPLDDLVSEGNMGLLIAIDRFDVSKGFKFSTYATWWIRHKITSAINDQSNNIRIPHSFRDKISLYLDFVNRYEKLYNLNPSLEQIALGIGMSLNEVKLIQQHLHDTISLETPIGEDGDTELGDLIMDENFSVESSFDNKCLSLTLRNIFSELNFNDREVNILVMRYGLDGNGIRTLDEIGQKYNITRERVRQIEAKLLMRIRKNKKCISLLSDFISGGEYGKKLRKMYEV